MPRKTRLTGSVRKTKLTILTRMARHARIPRMIILTSLARAARLTRMTTMHKLNRPKWVAKQPRMGMMARVARLANVGGCWSASDSRGVRRGYLFFPKNQRS